MKIKYLLLTLVVFLIYPFYVNAATCSKEERTRINALVNNIKINYTNISGNNFNISIENVPEELYVILPSGNTVYSYNQDEAKQATYLGGKRYTFRIYSTKNDECINEMNYTKTVYINKYNTYADKEICKDENYKDFIYCNKSYQGNITDEKFEKESLCCRI